MKQADKNKMILALITGSLVLILAGCAATTPVTNPRLYTVNLIGGKGLVSAEEIVTVCPRRGTRGNVFVYAVDGKKIANPRRALYIRILPGVHTLKLSYSDSAAHSINPYILRIDVVAGGLYYIYGVRYGMKWRPRIEKGSVPNASATFESQETKVSHSNSQDITIDVEHFIDLLEDGSPAIRISAARTLGTVYADVAESAMPSLNRLAKEDTHWRVRRAADIALQRIRKASDSNEEAK